MQLLNIERLFINRYQTATVSAYCALAALPCLLFPHPIALLPLAVIPLGLIFILKKTLCCLFDFYHVLVFPACMRSSPSWTPSKFHC